MNIRKFQSNMSSVTCSDTQRPIVAAVPTGKFLASSLDLVEVVADALLVVEDGVEDMRLPA